MAAEQAKQEQELGKAMALSKEAERESGGYASESESSSSDGEENGKRAADALEEDVDADELKALQEDLGEDERKGKRRRTVNAAAGSKSVNGSKVISKAAAEQADTAWQAFKDSNEKKEGASSSKLAEKQEEMVRVTRTYRFAGEEVTEEKLLPASDPEAKAFLQQQAKPKEAGSNSAISSTIPSNSGPPAAPPGPRRKKGGGLAAMSAAATAKPGKINTLEKSKMDWTQFKERNLDDQQRHELDAQTRGGASGLGTMKGYMERQNFLDRVQDRLEGSGGTKS